MRYLGVDGGGSKTRAVVVDEAGTVCGEGLAGASNHHAVGFASATAAIADAVTQTRCVADVACLGLAGIEHEGDRTRFEDWAARAGVANRVRVVHDSELLLAAGTPDGYGVALIAGTGSVAVGRTRDGRTRRVGGWGHRLGDEGSGHDLGRAALRRATQTLDGRSDAHALLDAVLRAWDLARGDQLIEHAYAATTTRRDIARLAEPVIALAVQGDAVACELVAAAVDELARTARVAASDFTDERPCLALAGGLLVGAAYVRDALVQRLGDTFERTQRVDDPVHGALRIARSVQPAR